MSRGTSDQERASAQEQLLEREEQYRRIFEATSDGLIINDFDTGLVVEVNPAFCRMHGYEYDELIGIHRRCSSTPTITTCSPSTSMPSPRAGVPRPRPRDPQGRQHLLR